MNEAPTKSSPTPHARCAAVVPDDPIANAALTVIAALREAGFSAFLVGGCVRDLLLGLSPKDYDVATSARPVEVGTVFDRIVEVGVAFGVVRVLIRRGGTLHEVEVATYRADGDYPDRRRPSAVRFTDAREDVLRRDFTLNGLLLDPFAANGGEVIDWVDGIADLGRRRLRAIGDPDKRFAEDALRLLRAVRFTARFDLEIDPATAAAIRHFHGGLDAISRERVQAEVGGMLQPPNAGVAVGLLADLGLAQTLWPTLIARDLGLKVTQARLSALVQQSSVALPLPLALAAFFWAGRAQSGELTATIADDLRLSGVDERRLRETWQLTDALLARLGAAVLPEVRADNAVVARILRAAEAGAALRLLCAEAAAAAATSATPWPAAHLLWLHDLQHLRQATPLEYWWPKRWVTGADLKRLGYAPSPKFRHAIAAAETVQLEGGTQTAALAAARDSLQSEADPTIVG